MAPIAEGTGVLEKDEELFMTEFSVNNYDVSATFIGKCTGDPSGIPSRYAQYLAEKVLNGYDEPYFCGVKYTGFDKENSSENIIYSYLASEGDNVHETIFTFTVDMQIRVGNDEENAKIEIETVEQEVAE